MTNKIASVRYLVATFCFLLLSFFSFSQNNFRINGKVRDANGQPLEGVTVVEKGTSNRTLTTADGNFTMTVASGNATLVLTSVKTTHPEIDQKV